MREAARQPRRRFLPPTCACHVHSVTEWQRGVLKENVIPGPKRHHISAGRCRVVAGGVMVVGGGTPVGWRRCVAGARSPAAQACCAVLANVSGMRLVAKRGATRSRLSPVPQQAAWIGEKGNARRQKKRRAPVGEEAKPQARIKCSVCSVQCKPRIAPIECAPAKWPYEGRHNVHVPRWSTGGVEEQPSGVA